MDTPTQNKMVLLRGMTTKEVTKDARMPAYSHKAMP